MISGIGGSTGWYGADRLWSLRARIDRLVGGPGRRGRADTLVTGQPLDFWRVEQVEAPSVLRLRAEMRMPGTAWLELSAVAAGPGRSTLVQRTAFAPWGPVGHAFWWAELPAHRVVYHRMLRALAAEAERRQGLRG